jgi:hypothetical protein
VACLEGRRSYYQEATGARTRMSGDRRSAHQRASSKRAARTKLLGMLDRRTLKEAREEDARGCLEVGGLRGRSSRRGGFVEDDGQPGARRKVDFAVTRRDAKDSLVMVAIHGDVTRDQVGQADKSV